MKYVVVVVCLVFCGNAWAAERYIGEGVQGRPQAHRAAIKNFYYRHGMGYTLHPSRAKTRRFWSHRRYRVLHEK